MSTAPESKRPSQSEPLTSGRHLATISHDGRFWDVFLEFADDPRRPASFRGLLCFCPVDLNDEEAPVRTTALIIEDSYEAAVATAHRLGDYELQGLLRSASI